jgi:hypothetical protein
VKKGKALGSGLCYEQRKAEALVCIFENWILILEGLHYSDDSVWGGTYITATCFPRRTLQKTTTTTVPLIRAVKAMCNKYCGRVPDSQAFLLIILEYLIS